MWWACGVVLDDDRLYGSVYTYGARGLAYAYGDGDGGVAIWPTSISIRRPRDFATRQANGDRSQRIAYSTVGSDAGSWPGSHVLANTTGHSSSSNGLHLGVR